MKVKENVSNLKHCIFLNYILMQNKSAVVDCNVVSNSKNNFNCQFSKGHFLPHYHLTNIVIRTLSFKVGV